MVGGHVWSSCIATRGPLSLSLTQVPSPALKGPLPGGPAQFPLPAGSKPEPEPLL